jgi:hypothetical protein
VTDRRIAIKGKIDPHAVCYVVIARGKRSEVVNLATAHHYCRLAQDSGYTRAYIQNVNDEIQPSLLPADIPQGLYPVRKKTKKHV